ncbi:Na+/H+ antiporter family-domain-containing protein [Phlyctochytrium arcticum]|nr:Na+/H+ antiporter family-domain-containing protein [Phlyctochytrium arcticum]
MLIGTKALAAAFLALASSLATFAAPAIDSIETPRVAHNGQSFTAEVILSFDNGTTPATIPWTVAIKDTTTIIANGTWDVYDPETGKINVKNTFEASGITLGSNGWHIISFGIGNDTANFQTYKDSKSIHVIPGGLSLIPIIILLAVAAWTKQVIPAMFIGIFLAAFFINGYNPLAAWEQTTSYYMAKAVATTDRIRIVLFTFWLSALIALIQKSGGAHGLAHRIAKSANNRWSAQWTTYILGCVIFFDDYASALIVGAQMRPITDLVFLSREKLAFLVHATSAPPASIVPLSSWIGFEIALIADQLAKIDPDRSAFVVFCETIPSRYYPLFMLLFIPISLGLKRDFGPMLKAERRAIKYHKLVNDDEVVDGRAEEVEVVEGVRHRALNAIVPLGSTVVVIILSLFLTGYYSIKEKESAGDTVSYSIDNIVGSGDSYNALIWGSFFGMTVAMIMYKIQRIMTFNQSVITALVGIRGIVEPLIILFLAWTIGTILEDVGTAKFLAAAISGNIQPGALPTLVFLISCITSYATGTSWGTMSIMFPLALPLAQELLPGNHHLLVATASSILTGSIFGDQCSPVSDTSILHLIVKSVFLSASFLRMDMYNAPSSYFTT